LQVSDNFGIQLDTGEISTGNAYNTYNLTNLDCPVSICVFAPNLGTAWDVEADGCGMSINQSGGQITQRCYEYSYEEKIAPSGVSGGDRFGDSVSIDGDYAIVGATGDDDLGPNFGAAYIYERSFGNTWAYKQKIKSSSPSSNAFSGDFFGGSVSIDGDYAIVGASGEFNNTGAVYIYKRNQSNGNWEDETKITASDGVDLDFFGRSVSISGDYAIVGALGDDDLGSSSGAAYIYQRSAGNSWGSELKLTASDLYAGNGDRFGDSVSISGDYAIVGAPFYDGNGGFQIGAAYIYQRSAGNSWGSETKLTASTPIDADRFGNSVSISGDYAIVGSQFDAGSSAGAAYIYQRSTNNNWGNEEKITAFDSSGDDFFGSSVSIDGDYAIVGAYKDDNENGNDSGSSYIYQRSTGNSWVFGQKLTASDGTVSDRFGFSVSISGDYAIAGAYPSDSAYIYKL
jgi:hypothetical protein